MLVQQPFGIDLADVPRVGVGAVNSAHVDKPDVVAIGLDVHAGQGIALTEESVDRAHGGENFQGANVDDGGVGMLDRLRLFLDNPDFDTVTLQLAGQGEADRAGADNQHVRDFGEGHVLLIRWEGGVCQS